MRTINKYLDNRELAMMEKQKELQCNQHQEVEEAETEYWEKKQREER